MEKIVRNHENETEKNGWKGKLHKYNYAFVNKSRKAKKLMGNLPKIGQKNCQNARKIRAFGRQERFDKPKKLWNNCANGNEFGVFSFGV